MVTSADSQSKADNGIVMVPVPLPRLQEVYALLARDPQTAPDPQPEHAPGTAEVKVALYKEPRVRRLRQELNRYPAAEAAVRLAAVAAIKGDGPVSIRDVEKESRLSQQRVAAQLGAMTKLCKRLFQSNEWPILCRWGAGQEQCMYYVMPEPIARLWLSQE